jgi:hypothetical protein
VAAPRIAPARLEETPSLLAMLALTAENPGCAFGIGHLILRATKSLPNLVAKLQIHGKDMP